ncbi:uncharacterized protein TRUGW13939_10138 [Talaromyces rugulosus]|uniref:DUF1917 domain-containing protein n=1 Tax=Talaromyces rugulosus TaxID=121627 RepID=A0A7H8R978_TALRU|nr:uncharacterized protein TRUGW13939_10138 [Talaromyces rugulosus]QKX62970.1 hypothetical protein TRUGW13939_10138 [Talaromyces rugulosus]
MSSKTAVLEDVLSDESSFYGDDDTKEEFENRAASYDGREDWLEFQQNSPAAIAYKTLHPPAKSSEADDDEAANLSSKLLPSHNKRAHVHDGRQEHCWHMNEPIHEFTSRLRPSDAICAELLGPWIRVRYPFTKEETSDEEIARFVSQGRRLLYDFEEDKSNLEVAHAKSNAKSTAPLTRKLNTMRKTLEKKLLSMARERGVTDGKWMFFKPPGQIDEYWTTIAATTSRGELGIQAKVATSSSSASSSDRVICVYTHDWEDKRDVRRVLEKSVTLGLVREDQKPIYYKCDAWTYLDIKANNPWGLKASMYSSRDILQGRP